MRQHYYPAVATQPPLAITARKLTELAIKPTAISSRVILPVLPLFLAVQRLRDDLCAEAWRGGGRQTFGGAG